MTKENAWLVVHGRRIDTLMRECEEYRFKGSYGGNLNLGEIIFLIQGACLEIKNLTERIEQLTEENEGLKEQASG